MGLAYQPGTELGAWLVRGGALKDSGMCWVVAAFTVHGWGLPLFPSLHL